MRHFRQLRPDRKLVVSPVRRAFVAFVLCAFLTACSLLCAQTGGTGAISGTVTDPSGAMVAGAQIKVTNAATGDMRTAQSNDQGLYVVSLLPPGQYSLEVTKSGFKTVSSPNVQVVVAETTALKIRMQTGTVMETVTVAASTVELQTESSEMGRVTDSEMVENLPLVTRNYTQIIALNPGVAQEVNNAGSIGRGGGSTPGVPGGGSIMSQGATSVDNNFEMNGLPVNDIESSGTYSSGVPVPNPDTIQEFKVQTGQYDATTGRDAGADVDLITKGGTNEFHGSIFEFFRNEDLNANDWFAESLGQPRPILRQNQYGFTLGGPVVKNKVLLFGSWQGTRQLNALDPSNHKFVYLPPLTNDRSYAGLGKTFGGDQGYLYAAYYPYLGPYDNQIIYPDGSNITPQAYALFNAKLPNGQYVIPTPQHIDPSQPLELQGTSFLSSPGTFNENQWMVNADFLVSDRNKVSVRYFGESSTKNLTLDFSTFGFPQTTPERFDVASVSDTYSLSSNLVNQFAVGLHRTTTVNSYQSAFNYSDIGMNVPAEVNPYVSIIIADDNFTVGLTGGGRFFEEEYNLADTLSWVKGKHRFTFGGEFDYGRDNLPVFFYPGFLIPLTWADLLLGQSNVYGSGYSNIWESLDGTGNLTRDWRYKDAAAYLQDDLKVTQRLTLNLGLRYEHIGDLGAAGMGTGNVDINALNPNPPATGSVDGFVVGSNYKGPALPAGVIKGSNTFGFSGQGQNVLNPRLGFAWLLPGSDRFVLRGGAGMYHTTVEGQLNLQLSAAAPYSMWSLQAGTWNVAASDANPFPAEPNYPVFPAYSSSTDFTVDAIAQDFRPPTTYHYSLGLQSKIPGGAVLDVSFAGARDLHTIMYIEPNQANAASVADPIRGQTTNTVANIPLRAPYIGFTTNSVELIKSANSVWFNALEASLSQQYKHRFQYQASYTFARELSLVPGFTLANNNVGATGDQHNLRSSYGPEPYIRPQRFVLSGLYDIPGPTQNRFLAATLGGWSVATATVVQSGGELSIGYNNLNNVYGETNDRASFAPGCTAKSLSTPGSVSHRVNNYINSACLTTPAVIGDDGIGTGFGNTPNGVLWGPDQVNADISVAKRVPTRWPNEAANVVFKTDFFNAFNHPNFAAPDLTYTPTASAFGTITAMSTNPRVIQFALKFSF
jgi:hypothetical protein